MLLLLKRHAPHERNSCLRSESGHAGSAGSVTKVGNVGEIALSPCARNKLMAFRVIACRVGRVSNYSRCCGESALSPRARNSCLRSASSCPGSAGSVKGL